MADDAAPPKKNALRDPRRGKSDVVLLGPPTADGAGLHVVRAREERLETGELRALREGKPIVGEIVSLKPREENPRICDVESSYKAPEAAPAATTGKGPAQVATQAYRDNWEDIFRKETLN
jgi:hypothetical protein